VEDSTVKTTPVKQEPTLDERVAAVLRSDDHHPSSTLSDLIAEVDIAIDAADQAGREARAIAADPKVIDHGALGRAQDAEHTAHRLRNGMAALKELEHEAQCRERLKAWHAEADVVEAKAVKLGEEMRELYPQFSAWLVDFLKRKSAVDAEVRGINESAPGYEARRIREIELLARNIHGYGTSQPIERLLKLPALAIGTEFSPPLLWPVVQPISLGVISMFAPNGSVQRDPSQPCLGFEMRDGIVCEIGKDAPPTVPPEPLHAPMTLREQALAEQEERAVELAKHAADSIAREKERERMNDARHNAEIARRAQAISK
jgi:hypothetical protein